jgi:uncharacterized protein YndB with AHSA1/START domain
MATREIWHEILINASPSAVYEAVTDAKKLAHWWTTGARGESAIGKRLEFWFGEFCAAEMEVTVLKPSELVRWRVTPKVESDWVHTEVEFKIFRVNKQTVLHFRHSNWREDAKMFPHCSLGWAIFLLSLKEFVETGKGRPYPYDIPVNMWAPPAKLEAIGS